MGLFDYTPYDSSYDYTDSFGGTDDWSLPVGTETSYGAGAGGKGLFTTDDMDNDSFNWLDSFLDNTGDDWYADVPSETGGDFTTDDLDYGGGNLFDDIFTPKTDYSDYSGYPDWMNNMSDEDLNSVIAGGGPAETEKGPLGGGWWPAIRNTLIGKGEGPLGGNILGGGEGGGGILGAILGLGGGGGGQGGGYQKDANGKLILDANGNPIPIGGGGGGLGGLLGGLAGGNPLLTFLAMKSLLKDEPSAEGSVPIGGEAYGGPAFNYQDYQPTNLQPALMPGVGYANQGGVPGMMHGGSTDQRPGDITFAKLEPGEFVIQKPAVDAVGIETLEQINNMGNGRSYNG